MQFSYNWLRELVEGLSTPAEELGRLITLKTAECDGIGQAGLMFSKASDALVISVEKIGESHNRKVVVDTTRFGRKIVVCGAPNCRVGMRTVYVALDKKTIDGVGSDGMLASAAELGVGRDHSGIVELYGTADRSLKHEPRNYELDWIILIDNKSLTHRPDLWGHYGMAREVAAITKNKLLDPVPVEPLPDAPSPVRVSVDDFALCPRYSALVFENVTIQPSPLWLQYRLESVGLNAINNVVDVTNFVMAELSQPMHAFDAEKLHGSEIIVRSARAGEKLAALNGETYELDPSNLVIADPECAVALAGVIGGAGSAISASTTRIVLESACFNASSVRRTSSRLKLRTDASIRFEKSQDPMNTVRGLKRALALLTEVSPGIRLVGGLAEAWRRSPEPPPIELPLDWLDRKLGAAVPAAEVRAILESLEFTVQEEAQTAPVERDAPTFSVRVPSWRATKDVTIKDDLVEEIGRMIGYDNIVPVAPVAPSRVPPSNPEREFHHGVREMAAAQGFTEVFNYSFVSEEQARAFGLDPAAHVEVLNPIVSDQNFLRASLLPGIWKNIRDNAKHFDAFRLFEIGREIHPDRETPHFVAAIYAKDDGPNPGKAGLLELKRLAECLLAGVTVRPAAARAYEHPRRLATVIYSGPHGDVELGRLFEFHPKMIETGRAAVLDLNLELLFQEQPETPRYHSLRRFPTSAFDITVAVPARTTIGEVQAAIPLQPEILSIEFLREFDLPDGRRSLSYRITAGASDRTISSEETGAIRTAVLDALTRLGYESRS
jgi:phenylalanyl-tRNA synthetase beta chain